MAGRSPEAYQTQLSANARPDIRANLEDTGEPRKRSRRAKGLRAYGTVNLLTGAAWGTAAALTGGAVAVGAAVMAGIDGAQAVGSYAGANAIDRRNQRQEMDARNGTNVRIETGNNGVAQAATLFEAKNNTRTRVRSREYALAAKS